jgi:predicted MFS family arabinose efflux permease
MAVRSAAPARQLGPKTSAGFRPPVILFLSLFATQAAILVVSPILPLIAADLGVSTTAVAQTRSVSGITAGVVALMLVTRGERYRLDHLLGAGLVALALGSLLSAAARGLPTLLGAQVVIGFGLAFVLSGGLAASEAWADGSDGARLLSLALLGQPVAWIVGQPIVGLVAGIHWRWAWLVLPLAASLGALGTVLLRDPQIPVRGPVCEALNVWRLPGVRVWAFGELLAFSALAGALVYAGTVVIGMHGVSVGVVGVVLGIGTAAYLPGNWVARRSLRSGPAPVLALAGGGAALGVALFGGVRADLATTAVVFAAFSFASAGRTLAGAALGLQLANGRRMAAMSIRTAMVQFGYLVGTLMGGILLPRWGFAGLGLAFAALFTAAALLPLAAPVHARLAPDSVGLLRRGWARPTAPPQPVPVAADGDALVAGSSDP